MVLQQRTIKIISRLEKRHTTGGLDWICSALEGDCVRGDVTAACNSLTGGYRKEEARSFSKVHSDRTRGNCQKVKHRKF